MYRPNVSATKPTPAQGTQRQYTRSNNHEKLSTKSEAALIH